MSRLQSQLWKVYPYSNAIVNQNTWKNSNIIFLDRKLSLWYISKNGTDSSDCGNNYESACATFTQLWQHLVEDDNNRHKYPYWVTRDTNIMTNTDLLIEDMHLHAGNQKLAFKNLASNILRITIINTTIEDTELDFGGSISLHIEDSFILSPGMTFSQHVLFLNCSFFGHTKVENTTSSELTQHKHMYLVFKNAMVQFFNCNVTGIKSEDKHDEFIYCSSSNITMMTMMVKENEVFFMKIVGCNIQVTNSHFRNNKGLTLLSIYQSQLIFKNSHLLKNIYRFGGITMYGSYADLINSTFTGNQAVNYGCLTTARSFVTTIRCQFLKNKTKTKGTAVFISAQSQYNDHYSVFADNFAEEGGKIINQTKLISYKEDL